MNTQLFPDNYIINTFTGLSLRILQLIDMCIYTYMHTFTLEVCYWNSARWPYNIDAKVAWLCGFSLVAGYMIAVTFVWCPYSYLNMQGNWKYGTITYYAPTSMTIFWLVMSVTTYENDVVMVQYCSSDQFLYSYLNQVLAWFLKIAFVQRVGVCVFVCVCLPEAINN